MSSDGLNKVNCQVVFFLENKHADRIKQCRKDEGHTTWQTFEQSCPDDIGLDSKAEVLILESNFGVDLN